MKILLMLSLTYLMSCSTPKCGLEEDTRLVWGQEDKSIEDILEIYPMMIGIIINMGIIMVPLAEQ